MKGRDGNRSNRHISGKLDVVDKEIQDALDISIRSLADDYELSDELIKEAQQRLYALPAICARCQEAIPAGFADLVEVAVMKRALFRVADDPCYSIIPAIYFNGLDFRSAAIDAGCTKASLLGQHGRLIKRITFSLYGARAWKKWENMLARYRRGKPL